MSNQPYEVGNSNWWGRKSRTLNLYAQRKGRYGQRVRGGQLRELWDASGGRCVWCNKKMNLGFGPAMDAATVDHVIELRCGGSHSIDNLAFACGDCNSNRTHRRPFRLSEAA